ncbi:hypothetical protein Ga0100231_017455 [Opitutaceae bacterium TAV4]|uniref:hypothetical protein n=1 Tax=Geminisphaera colitermitum TaxID=1148786 RepID=UPI0001965331|nr:hypothetical protein [Geminisphaera colitermitum]RRJ95792.1 hypothetical protein Ga0100231_017455 [Opitutaceae bacterium TAV4]RRJ99210.1 hypothetical protein Ga0100230_013395 [Opitutaceae bacterium TAV3]
MSNQPSALSQNQHSTPATAKSRSFLRFTRFRKAWFIALAGGFLLAWGTHRFGDEFLESLAPGFGSDTHLAAPGSERSEYSSHSRYQRKRWRESPFDEPAAAPASPTVNPASEHSGNP